MYQTIKAIIDKSDNVQIKLGVLSEDNDINYFYEGNLYDVPDKYHKLLVESKGYALSTGIYYLAALTVDGELVYENKKRNDVLEERMSVKSCDMVISLLSHAIDNLQTKKSKVKPKSISVKDPNGEVEIVHSEKDLWNMYCADYFTYSEYDRHLNRFRKHNVNAEQQLSDYVNAIKYLTIVRQSLGAYKNEKLE